MIMAKEWPTKSTLHSPPSKNPSSGPGSKQRTLTTNTSGTRASTPSAPTPLISSRPDWRRQFPKNDGKQTPMKEHPIFIAQHATGTCCRESPWEWYRIEKGRALTEGEIGIVVELVMGVDSLSPEIGWTNG